MVLQPRYLLLENVVGLLNHDGGRSFHTILCALDELGYDAEWQVLNCKDEPFYIPQTRKRVFIIGHLRGFGGRKVFPLGCYGGEDTRRLTELTQGVADAHRIYDGDGLARTLKSEGGGLGAKTGLYEVSDTLRASGCGNYDGKHSWGAVQMGVVRKGRGEDTEYSTRDVALTIDANYYKGLDAHQARTGVAVINSDARDGKTESDIVGTLRANAHGNLPMVRAVLTPDRAEKRQNGRRVKDEGEPMFTLTVQDRHGVAITVKRELQHSRGFETKDDDKSHCIKGGGSSKNSLETQTRIRRLTPLECWRLMGREDWEHEAAKAAGLSDSQRYKQAGNSLVPQIVTEIARELEWGGSDSE